MKCWYCYWGWAKPVAEIYLRALADLGGNEIPLDYGPGHIVWGDENFDSAEWCLEHFDEYADGLSEHEKRVVRRSLEELVALPMEVRCVEPEDYDGEHPENYPPAVEVVHAEPPATEETGGIDSRVPIWDNWLGRLLKRFGLYRIHTSYPIDELLAHLHSMKIEKPQQ